MDQVPSQVAATLLTRMRNPLVASFVISWLVFNWKIPLFLLAITEPTAARAIAIEAAVLQHGSLLYPVLVSLAYFLLSPWLWLALRVYLDMPEARSKQRDRRQREAEQVHESEFLEREVKLIQARQQKLQANNELDRIKAQASAFFEVLATDMNQRCEATAERIRTETHNLEAALLPRLQKIIEEQSTLAAAIETRVQRSIEELRRNVEIFKGDLVELKDEGIPIPEFLKKRAL